MDVESKQLPLPSSNPGGIWCGHYQLGPSGRNGTVSSGSLEGLAHTSRIVAAGTASGANPVSSGNQENLTGLHRYRRPVVVSNTVGRLLREDQAAIALTTLRWGRAQGQ